MNREAREMSEGARHHQRPLSSQQTTADTVIPWRPLSLIGNNNCPPVDAASRKRARKSAVYLSECLEQGVSAQEANDAAEKSQKQYQKWWMGSYFQKKSSPHPADRLPPREKPSSSIDSVDGRNATVVTGESGHMQSTSKKRKRKREEGIRDYIDDISVVSISSVSAIGRDDASAQENDGDLTLRIRTIPNLSQVTVGQIHRVRDRMIDLLKQNSGNLDDGGVQECLSILESFYTSSHLDIRSSATFPYDIDGTWLTLSKPTYPDCKGTNRNGDYLFSLGRMSFDMFRPTGLVCSIQGVFNTVSELEGDELPFSVPRSLRKDVSNLMKGKGRRHGGLRAYNIVTALSIEPRGADSGNTDVTPGPDRSIRGIMTNYGYVLPDPLVANRWSVWFTGGSLEVNDEKTDLGAWKNVFADTLAPRLNIQERARMLAARFLLGAELPTGGGADGSMVYRLRHPIGGHGSAFCDVLYMDDKCRIARGHHGSVFVFTKVRPNGPVNNDK